MTLPGTPMDTPPPGHRLAKSCRSCTHYQRPDPGPHDPAAGNCTKHNWITNRWLVCDDIEGKA